VVNENREEPSSRKKKGWGVPCSLKGRLYRSVMGGGGGGGVAIQRGGGKKPGGENSRQEEFNIRTKELQNWPGWTVYQDCRRIRGNVRKRKTKMGPPKRKEKESQSHHERKDHDQGEKKEGDQMMLQANVHAERAAAKNFFEGGKRKGGNFKT